jgi:phosphate:Na+ symporter
MGEIFQVITGMLGGLALFLFGMTMMSESLQKAAGERMRKVLSALTKNAVLGVISGAVVTAVLQSSSATTVMAIGFVSAGLMNLPQAISIIFGANIGTTITAQIIAFNISEFVPLIIFVGFMILFLSKNLQVKYIGETIFAFGVLFLGIDTMGTVMKPLASSPVFLDMIGKVADNRILGLLTGLSMTLVVQSSSATIAVLQNFASQAAANGTSSILGLKGAIPILLGDNIGTTVTGAIASVGQRRDAKRVALAHIIFNLTGSILFIFFIDQYANIIQAISPLGAEVDVISRQIANAHTGFNVIMTLIWTPLLPLMVKIVTKVIPDEKEENGVANDKPKYLDDRLMNQPTAALQLVSQEILRVSSMVYGMLQTMREDPQGHVTKRMQRLSNRTENVSDLCKKINNYMNDMISTGSLDEEQAAKATGLLFMTNEMERISSLCHEIAENITNMRSKEKQFSLEATEELHHLSKLLLQLYEDAIHVITDNTSENRKLLAEDKETIMKLDEKVRKAHMQRVSQGKCDSSLTAAYNALLHNVERIGNCCIDLAEMGSDGVEFNQMIIGDVVETGL